MACNLLLCLRFMMIKEKIMMIMFLTGSEVVSQDLLKYLESENNSFDVQVDRYLQSFLAFLIIAVVTTFILIVAIWVLTRFKKYWTADLVRSKELQHALMVDAKWGMKSIENTANKVVKNAVVIFRRNQVVLRIPIKTWWQVWTSIEVQEEVKRRINTPEFKEWLVTHYGSYHFSEVVPHKNYYELVGEAY